VSIGGGLKVEEEWGAQSNVFAWPGRAVEGRGRNKRRKARGETR